MATENIEIIKLFKEQLTNQIGSLYKKKNFNTPGYAFCYWYLTQIANMSDLEAKDQICDGGGDLGIDAISIADEQVIFYQFKNPASIDKPIETGDIDKLISGLSSILAKNHEKIANPELISRIEEIYSFTPHSYKIIIVSSSLTKIPNEAKNKLDGFCKEKGGLAKDMFKWEFHNLDYIHNRFYTANLPTLEATLNVSVKNPYMAKVGDHETYVFDLSGRFLADLYDQHGESILQQNVRMFEGENGTNLAIESTATDANESKNFFHFNNGISIICDVATYQPFTSTLSLERPQIVNGGQTIRILHKTHKEGKLKPDVQVMVRVITTGKDKQFSSNVAVNLNNQTRVDNTFLRSNDPRIVQLLHSLSALGYFLERRAGEVAAMLPEEVEDLEKKYGSPLENHTIPLKDGMQAYVATYFKDPQLAKKDPAKIFTDDGGKFSAIMASDLTAEKFRDAYELSKTVSEQVEKFKKIKRKRYTNTSERNSAYISSIGSTIKPVIDELDEAIPQITIFGMALLFEKYQSEKRYQSFNDYIEEIKKSSDIIWGCFSDIIQAKSALNETKSWPTLLKSGTFYKSAVNHIIKNQKTEIPKSKLY